MNYAGMDDGDGPGFAPSGSRLQNGNQRYAPRVRQAPLAPRLYADDLVAEDEEEVVDEGRELLERLMIKELKKDGGPHSSTQILIRQFLEKNAARRGGVYQQTAVMQQNQIVDALSRIGDALEADRELTSLITQVPPEASWETFQNVAKTLFADGTVTWGRIVALFFFACKMVKRSIDSVPLVKLVLDWVSGIIKAYLASWVLGRGGWRAVMEWFGPRWSQIGMAFGVFCTTYAVAIAWSAHR